jgi:hypothetical protein
MTRATPRAFALHATISSPKPRPCVDASAPVAEATLVRYGGTTAYVGDSWVTTALPDGRVVYATPNHDDESNARALELGYSGVEAMTREHDPMHALLCHALGLDYSPALSRAADGLRATELSDAEEAMVLAAQRFRNLCRAAGIEGA